MAETMTKGVRPPTASAAGRTPKRPWRLALLLAVLLVGLAWAVRSWREYGRPGRVHYDRGADAAAGHHFEAAAREWRLGTQEDPSFPGCWERLGDLSQQAGDAPRAAADFAAAARLRPEDGHLFQKLAVAEMAQENEREALPAARRAYDLLPGDADVAGTYGLLAARAADIPAATAALERAHRLAPGVQPYLMKLLTVEADAGNWGALVTDAGGYLRDHPDDSWACYMMAVAQKHLPRRPETLRAALGYARRSAASPVAPGQVYPLLAQLSLDAGRPQDARQACDWALARAGNDPEVLYELIACYTRLNQPQKVSQISALLQPLAARRDRIVFLRQLIRHDPRDVPHGLELARLEEADGDREQARQCYAILARIAPQNPRVRAAAIAFGRRTGGPPKAP